MLARAFREITGISVIHELVREGELIMRLEKQMTSGRNLYDAYVNDADLIGTHYRYGKTVPLSDWMDGDGAAFTLPSLDLDDFIGLSFTTGPDGKVYQLPDQQFANLYWFRYDWFQRDALRDAFQARHGYPLGVPVNWKAYEDIADFFTNTVREIDGERVWGHMDYGKRDPSLGWRFTDAWLAMAGVGDPGLPNGSAGGRVGHPGRELPSGRLQRQPRRRDQRPGGGLRAPQVSRMARSLCAAGGKGDDLFGSRAGAGERPHRPADLLVHRLHRRRLAPRPAARSKPMGRRSGGSRPPPTAPTGKRG